MPKYEKFCQSCSMPLKDGEMSGTEADGSKSMKYCQLCYRNGHFISPDMTMDDMKKILDESVGKEGLMGKLKAFMGKMMLPRLERWRA